MLNPRLSRVELKAQLDKTTSGEIKKFIREILKVPDARKPGGWSFNGTSGRPRPRAEVIAFVLDEANRQRSRRDVSTGGGGGSSCGGNAADDGNSDETADFLDEQELAEEAEIDAAEREMEVLTVVPDTSASAALARSTQVRNQQMKRGQQAPPIQVPRKSGRARSPATRHED